MENQGPQTGTPAGAGAKVLVIDDSKTIRRTAEADYKYIKQTGGKGQYGHVKIRLSPMQPLEEGEEVKKKKAVFPLFFSLPALRIELRRS